jgi:hypothetical protein
MYPAYPVPPAPASRTEGRAFAALVFSLTGLVFGLLGFGLAGIGLLTQLSDLIAWLIVGLPAMILGPIAYFLGMSAISRMAASPATLGGRSIAITGWMIGAASTAVGATATLIWFVILLVAAFGPPPR